ncbi:MAG: hypothetical protein AB1898_24120 [Acidobacteriota bacterium]
MTFLAKLFKKKKPVSRRASRRIPAKIPLLVTGKDAYGHSFRVHAYTAVVNKTGGRLICDKDVEEGQSLKLTDPNGNAYIVKVRTFKYDPASNRRHVGFKVIEPTANWAQKVTKYADYHPS